MGLWGLMFLGLLWVKRKWDADRDMDPKLRKYLKARKAIENRLERANAFEDSRAFHEELSLAIKEYFCDKLDMEMAQFTKEGLEGRLGSKGVPPEHIKNCLEILTRTSRLQKLFFE